MISSGHLIGVQGDHGAMYECCVVTAVTCRPKGGAGTGTGAAGMGVGIEGVEATSRYYIGEAVYIDVEFHEAVQVTIRLG